MKTRAAGPPRPPLELTSAAAAVAVAEGLTVRALGEADGVTSLVVGAATTLSGGAALVLVLVVVSPVVLELLAAAFVVALAALVVAVAALVVLAAAVVADAVERSMALATSMEARGFGHSRRPGTGPLVLVVGAMASLTLGTYLVLGSPAAGLGTGCLAVGAVGAVAGLRASGKALTVSRYRPNVWSWQAWLVGVSGLVAAGCVLATSWGLAHPSTDPPEWPALAPLSLVAAALLAAPLLLTTREPA